MFSFKSVVATTLLVSALMASSAYADGDYLSLNAGEYDALRGNGAFQYGAEYRFSDVGYGFHPIIGGFGNGDGSAYGYAGINWAVALLPNQLYIVPNFAVGAWHQGDNNNKKLGGTIEFRSGIELDYQFPNGQQIGAALNHISNAGIYSRNPGEETIMATYSIPVSTVRHWVGF